MTHLPCFDGMRSSPYAWSAEPSEVAARARDVTATPSDEHDTGNVWNEKACLDYLSGAVKEQLLKERAGQHGYAKASAYNTMAMEPVGRRRKRDR